MPPVTIQEKTMWQHIERASRVVLKGVIRTYQILVSPVLGNNCRFHPNCSTYAIEAINQHGAMGGAWLAVKRITRCHPWHPGGFDPVPLPDEPKKVQNKPITLSSGGVAGQ